MQQKKSGKLSIIMVLILFVAVTAASVPIINIMMQPKFQQELAQWVESAGIAGVGALLLMQILQVVVAFIPGEPVEVVAGAMYGTVGGLLVCLAGLLVGSSAIFYVVRRLGRERLKKTSIYPKLLQYKFLRDDDKLMAMVFLLYLIPGTPKDILVYVCALTKLPMKDFLIVSTLARIPSVITSTMAGASFASGNHLTTLIIFLVTGIAGLLGIAYHKKRFGDQEKKETE